MRVLILSANTGAGHNSTAGAIAEALEKRGAEYEIADALAFISEKVSDFISKGHSYVYRKLPRLFGLGYRFEERHSVRFIYEQCAKGAPALQKKLEEAIAVPKIAIHISSTFTAKPFVVKRIYNDLILEASKIERFDTINKQMLDSFDAEFLEVDDALNTGW